MSATFPIPLVLASQSPRRRQILDAMGYVFDVVVSDVEEIDHPEAIPNLMVEHNAQLKAREVAKRRSESLVIAADTTVFLNDRVFAKPKDLDDARAMLKMLSGKRHTVYTGLCLKCANLNFEEVHHVESYITFKVLDDVVIDSYFAQVNPLDRAGAYSIQDYADLIVEKVEGSLSNTAGLPAEYLLARLRGLAHRFEKNSTAKT
jgi:septum formation protein